MVVRWTENILTPYSPINKRWDHTRKSQGINKDNVVVSLIIFVLRCVTCDLAGWIDRRGSPASCFDFSSTSAAGIELCLCLLARIEGDLHHTKKGSRLNPHPLLDKPRKVIKLASLCKVIDKFAVLFTCRVTSTFNQLSQGPRIKSAPKWLQHLVKRWLHAQSQFKDELFDSLIACPTNSVGFTESLKQSNSLVHLFATFGSCEFGSQT